MARFSSTRRPLARSSLYSVAFGALGFALAACSSDDTPDGTAGPQAAGTGGSTGGGSGQVGGQGGTAGGSTGGSSAVTGGASGSSSHAGTGSGSRAGTSGLAGGGSGSVGGAAAGTAGRAGPPEPSDDGSSPYERECHGDTIECVDVQTLRCLGIRDESTIYGYSCSNTCETDADCSDAPTSGEAKAGCVDFVTQKHCLLVCLSDGAKHSCPDGMGCYVYPQSPIGYCLWQ